MSLVVSSFLLRDFNPPFFSFFLPRKFLFRGLSDFLSTADGQQAIGLRLMRGSFFLPPYLPFSFVSDCRPDPSFLTSRRHTL